MIFVYFGILGLAALGVLVCRVADRPSPVCWTMATGLILLVFCADLGRSLLTASPVDLGSTLGAAVVPVAVGLWLSSEANQSKDTTSGK
jgi:hypothetical protein